MAEERNKPVAVGPEMFTLLFGALGFERVEADAAGATEVLRGLVEDPSVALVVCAESAVPRPMTAEFHDLCSRPDVAVLILPDEPETANQGYELTRTLIEAAAGVDLLGPLHDEPNADGPGETETRTEN